MPHSTVEHRAAVCNGDLDWVCGPCLAQENEQPANNHDEVIYFYYNSQ